MQLAVLVPVGPGEDHLDTLASILHFTAGALDLVLVDDRPEGSADDLHDVLDGVRGKAIVIPADRRAPGARGGLYYKLAQGFARIADELDPQVILRMDTDALVVGPDPGAEAAARFASDPRVGLLGAYTIGPSGGRRGFGPPARLLRRETGPRGLVDRRRRATLRPLVTEARGQGYRLGEHALGGAYFVAPHANRELRRRGWLDLDPLISSSLGEDHIFSLLIRAAGFGIQDFGGPGDPLAVRWRGLHAAVEEILDSPAKVVHSVRSWRGSDEAEIRASFRRQRSLVAGRVDERDEAGS